MQACVIIPARFSSSRFPGKPLVPLLGKPMVIWVAELAAQAIGRKHVFVATENERIANVVRNEGYAALMTSSDAITGTDRLAEAAHMIDYDIYVNVQGDEPLVDPEDIRRCIDVKSANLGMIVNGFCWMSEHEDPSSVNIPKVITTEAGMMVYISRKPLPGFKEKINEPIRYKKQVCIYGFTGDDLEAFTNYGKKSTLEQAEDVEILRYLELERRVKMFECQPGSLAVDIPEDIVRVEKALREKKVSN